MVNYNGSANQIAAFALVFGWNSTNNIYNAQIMFKYGHDKFILNEINK